MNGTFIGNPKSAIISSYISINNSISGSAEEYYTEGTSLLHNLDKHNMRLLCGYTNAQKATPSEEHYFYPISNRILESLCEIQDSTVLVKVDTRFQTITS